LVGGTEEKVQWVKEEKDGWTVDSMNECTKIEVFTDKRSI
jgi:hypothetical protein